MLKLIRVRLMKNYNSDYIAEFLRLKSTRAKATHAFYKTGLLNYLAHVGDSWPPTPELLTDWLASMRAAELSNATCFAYWRATKSWLDWLRTSGKLTTDPTIGVNPPKKTRRKIPKAPPKPVIEKLMAYLDDQLSEALRPKLRGQEWCLARDVALFSMIVRTGMRVGEAASLTVDRLELDNNRAFLAAELTKDREDRYIIFNDQCRADLKFWLQVRESLDPPVPNVFLSMGSGARAGLGALTVIGIERILARRCLSAGLYVVVDGDKIPVITPHLLRHYYATEFVEDGGPLNVLQSQLGHADLKTTSIYTVAASSKRDKFLKNFEP